MIFARFINIERLIHSLKTCIACILAFILTKVIDFPADQWIIVTVVVVMCSQIYVGSVIQKSYLRFLGTLTGCLFAASTLMLYGHSTAAIMTTVAIGSFIFSYIATSQESLSYAGSLGAVTLCIIMIGQNPSVKFAGERFLEISIGILIATLVSQFILPIHARTHLRRAQANTLAQLKSYYQAVISSLRDENNKVDYHELDEAIVKTLLKQRALAKESLREPLATAAFNPTLFSQSLYYEREMLRAVTFMHTALTHVKQAEAIIMTSGHAKAFNDAILAILDSLKTVIQSNKPTNIIITLPSLEGIKDEMLTIQMPSREELVYINGFLFSAEIMLNSLKQLASLYNVLAHDLIDDKTSQKA